MTVDTVTAIATEARRPSRRDLPAGAIDHEAATRAVFDLLVAMGQDPTSEELIHTPRRVVTSLASSLTPEPFAMTVFPNDAGYDEMVIVRDISFQSLCSCHMLPFGGTAHVAYVPRDHIVGLSKIVRVVEHFSRGLQTQSRLTGEVADAMETALEPRGVGVAMKARHQCMAASRGESVGPDVITSAMRGSLGADLETRDQFTRLVR